MKGVIPTSENLAQVLFAELRGGRFGEWLDEVRIYDRALSGAEILSLPGPSDSAIFSDGFESGDTSAWSATVP